MAAVNVSHNLFSYCYCVILPFMGFAMTLLTVWKLHKIRDEPDIPEEIAQGNKVAKKKLVLLCIMEFITLTIASNCVCTQILGFPFIYIVLHNALMYYSWMRVCARQNSLKELYGNSTLVWCAIDFVTARFMSSTMIILLKLSFICLVVFANVLKYLAFYI